MDVGAPAALTRAETEGLVEGPRRPPSPPAASSTLTMLRRRHTGKLALWPNPRQAYGD